MASGILSHLQGLWPFSLLKPDDLKNSIRLVQKLSIPDQTKQFVLAFSEPDSGTVVYILVVQDLSEQSALDAEYLIKGVHPKAVVVQVYPSALSNIQAVERWSRNDQAKTVPTSYFGVLKRCFIEKINKDQYENFAGCQVLQEIFGVGFCGHLFAAKKAAEQINSHFLLLESPEKTCTIASSSNNDNLAQMHTNCMLLGKVDPALYSRPSSFCITDAFQLNMINSVIPYLGLVTSKEIPSNDVSEPDSEKSQTLKKYKAPSFAQSFYPLLQDLHDIFIDLPSITKAMISTQTMLTSVNEGKPINTETLSDVYIFRIAVEFLRAALNNAARSPITRTQNDHYTESEFFKLPAEDQSHILFAQALKNQAMKFGSVVAIVDVTCFIGLRKHWNTSAPLKVTNITGLCFEDNQNDEKEATDNVGKKDTLADKPVIAVGAGATALLGVSSLSKALPASTITKLATYKVPVILKFGLSQVQRAVASTGLAKIFGSSKIFSHGIASAGAKATTLKFTATAEKIRAVTHTVIASAERTSFLAMRTSFYEIMRMRHVRRISFIPLATFGFSVITCTGLLTHGDGIECAAESIPSVPMITSLGRGLQSLQETSMKMRQTNATKIREALHSLMHKFKRT